MTFRRGLFACSVTTTMMNETSGISYTTPMPLCIPYVTGTKRREKISAALVRGDDASAVFCSTPLLLLVWSTAICCDPLNVLKCRWQNTPRWLPANNPKNRASERSSLERPYYIPCKCMYTRDQLIRTHWGQSVGVLSNDGSAVIVNGRKTACVTMQKYDETVCGHADETTLMYLITLAVGKLLVQWRASIIAPPYHRGLSQPRDAVGWTEMIPFDHNVSIIIIILQIA